MPCDIKFMAQRLSRPYWSPLHPTQYLCHCEGEFGPGAEFKARAEFKGAWSIFWAMSYKLRTPEQVETMDLKLMRRVISAATNVSRITIGRRAQGFPWGS